MRQHDCKQIEEGYCFCGLAYGMAMEILLSIYEEKIDYESLKEAAEEVIIEMFGNVEEAQKFLRSEVN